MFPLPHRLGPYSFCARRVVAAALLLAAAASPVGAQSSRERPYPVRRATSEIVVDGRVLEEAWADALTLELRYEVRPGENVEPPVRTEMFLAYDDTRLLVAFKCHDPDPSQIRARYTDRDNAWNDDFVGVVLDTFNDERRAYELFVNAYGVQMDAVNDDVAGNYDMAWGAIWDSAGRITDAGYEVEMAIPFNQLRFQDAGGAQTWGIDGVRSYPRLQRHHIGLFPRLRGANSYLSQEEKIRSKPRIAVSSRSSSSPTRSTRRRCSTSATRTTASEPIGSGCCGPTARSSSRRATPGCCSASVWPAFSTWLRSFASGSSPLVAMPPLPGGKLRHSCRRTVIGSSRAARRTEARVVVRPTSATTSAPGASSTN